MSTDNMTLAPAKWINTPFAYTRFSRNMSLLQQDVLLRVSSHIQRYMQEYFGSDLSKAKNVPKPLFSEAQKSAGIGQMHIDYAELGVAQNNYFAARKAVKEVLAITIEAPYTDKETGKIGMKTYNVFTEGGALEDSTGITFGLNMDVVDYVFDMSQGFINHPEDIAQISTVERMPMIYYLIKRESKNWRYKQVKMTIYDIKNYLGMIDRDAEGNIKKIAYKKFSQFRSKVLDPAMADLDRLRNNGQIDVSMTYEACYPGARKVGDPAYLLFTVDNTKKANAVVVAADAVQQPNTVAGQNQQGLKDWQVTYNEQHGDPSIAQSRRGWANFCAGIADPRGKAIWLAMRTVRIERGKLLLAGGDKQIADFKDYWENTLSAPIREQVLIRLGSECMRQIDGFAFQQAIK